MILVVVMSYFFFFFFSSRRRHTRSDRDWSSDVCSSDLAAAIIRRRVTQFGRGHPPPAPIRRVITIHNLAGGAQRECCRLICARRRRHMSWGTKFPLYGKFILHPPHFWVAFVGSRRDAYVSPRRHAA